MELEQMKMLWQQYDENIQKNNSLNDTIIKKMLQQNSKDIIGKMTGYEYLNIAIGSIFTLLILGAGPTFLHLPGVDGILTLCYFISVICGFTALFANFYMTYFLNNTDLSQPVTIALPRINKLSLITAKSKIFNMILLPVFVLAAVPVGRKWFYNENMFEQMGFWAPMIGVALLLGIIATLFLYRTLYTNRIKAIRQNLEEIERFKQE